jgi:drug/metabolite transporter (DMT)-like permease
MGIGVMMLGFALVRYLQGVLPETWRGKHDPAGLLLLFGGMGAVLGLIQWGTKAIKKYITWPRTGYVAYRRDRKSRWIVIVAAAAFATGCVCLMEFTRRHDWISLQRMCYLALWVPVYALWIYRMERHHPWKWLVLFFMALGLLAIGLIGPGDIVGLGRPVGLFLGLTWLGSGAATLYLYIRHTQPPAPEIE